MKKILFAILGAVTVFAACNKNELPYIDQNPYRKIVEYTPGTAEMAVPGLLTPDENYDWISVQQIGNAATFTIRRNTTGLMRKAFFTIAGESYKAIIFQKEHGLDAMVSASVLSQAQESIKVNATLTTDYPSDYEGWGLAYGKTDNLSAATKVKQQGVPAAGNNVGEIKGLEDGVDYYIWAYVISTEGDEVYSDMLAVISPVFVKAGENLQAAIDGAKEYSEIRVAGGATFKGVINFTNANSNKKVSGGWNSDFTAQSLDNLTVIDGNNETRGFWCAELDNSPLKKSAEISYFEIINCTGDHGSAVHVCGGPVIVHHCYVHDNECEKGAIGTREEDYSSDITVYNCIVSNNRADGHGAAFGFGDGASYEDQVKAVIVNNLIVNNLSYSFDGYCSVFICYNNTDLVFVNNTVYGNLNFEEYGGEYPGMNMRGNVRSLYANNIMVGNKTSKNVTPAVYTPMVAFLSFDGGAGTFVNNVYEGTINGTGNATVKDNQMIDSGASLDNVMVDPANGNYIPVGISLGKGILSKVSYKENRDAVAKELDIKALLTKYNTDLAGNPRVTNGKVDCGCFQAQ